MTALFFYGTLRHAPLLEVVLGRPGTAAVSAVLPDHAVFWARDQPFPMIDAEPGFEAKGLLVTGLLDTDVARFDFYEGGFAYTLRTVKVTDETGTDHAAQVYFPDPGTWERGAPFELHDWVAQWGALSLDAAREVMLHFGKMEARRMQQLLPFYRARAWSRNLACTTAPQTLRSGMTTDDVTLLRDRPGYEGFFRIRAFDLQHRLFDGSHSEPMSRETFVAFDAALVLPYDPGTDRIMLIEQLRFGPIMRGDSAPWVLEPIAGLIDAGEDPADCARREAVEEAGIHIRSLEPMVKVYASPGYSTEYFHCFLGLCDLDGHGGTIGGKDDEHEDIRNHVLPLDEALHLVETGEINAAPLAMMLLWLARERPRLRAPG